jgi:tRNA nucleotidyltransferase (CCA-adding enzyme)
LGRLDPAWHLPEKIGHTPIRRALALLVWLSSLPVTSALEIANCLRLAGYLVTPLSSLIPLLQALAGLVTVPPSRVVAVLEEKPLISLYTARLLNLSSEINGLLDRYILEWHNIHPSIDGETLHALGVPPGPAYHTILDTLRAAWLDGKINTVEEERVLLTELIVKYTG